MDNRFEVAVVGTDVGKKKLRALTREKVNKTIIQREQIVRSFGIENPRESLSYAVKEAKKHLLEIHNEAGIPLAKKGIPDVIFVDEKRKKELESALQPYAGANFNNKEVGISSIWNGVTIVFVKDDITDLDYAGIIFHEMFHSVGKQVIAANERAATYGRIGYEIFGMNSLYKPWLLEEGVIVYESARFTEKLEDNPLYKHNAETRAKKNEHLKQWGDIVNGRIKFDSGMEIEPRYCWLMPKGYGPPTNAGIAGSLFELITSKFRDKEKESFLNMVYAARRDLRLIPRVANIIDSKWGKGTYTRMLKCERTEEAVWNFIQDLRGIVKARTIV